MPINAHKAMVIAKKEFADHLTSPVFLSFAVTFTITILAWSYVKGMEVDYTSNVLGMPDLMRGFKGMAMVVGRFAPVIGIVMGFDSIVKEIRSSSMNVLLTHPVFRDNIIAGKIIGSSMCILLTLIISINIAAGVMLIVSGMPVTIQYLTRIEIFVMLTFFYSLFFLAISVLISTIVNKSNISLLYNIAIWLVFTILFAQLIFSSTYVLTNDVQAANSQTLSLLNFVPGHHYVLVSAGMQDVVRESFDDFPKIAGVFDTGYTLFEWLSEFWTNLIVLIVSPIIVLILSFIVFLRRDITL
ncbi:MAG: ABC transporter permease [Methanomethylovorans sp.]|uniref:ABC transporter permease n=1 Tax=Methanomethylovorans sp. TaxID=2758717 RepID=UPI003530600D